MTVITMKLWMRMMVCSGDDNDNDNDDRDERTEWTVDLTRLVSMG